MRIGILLLALIAACSGDDGTAPGDGAPGKACGGFAGAMCVAGQFCDYADDSCGAADQAGSCAARPEICTPIIDEVCGCDGKKYQSPCEAQRAGVDVRASGGCN